MTEVTTPRGSCLAYRQAQCFERSATFASQTDLSFANTNLAQATLLYLERDEQPQSPPFQRRAVELKRVDSLPDPTSDFWDIPLSGQNE